MFRLRLTISPTFLQYMQNYLGMCMHLPASKQSLILSMFQVCARLLLGLFLGLHITYLFYFGTCTYLGLFMPQQPPASNVVPALTSAQCKAQNFSWCVGCSYDTLQGKALLSTSTIRDCQANDTLPDVRTLVTFECRSRTSIENVILTIFNN